MVANMKLMKRMNRARILTLLREGEGLSRVRLRALTGLDGTTITNLTRGLLADRMLLSLGHEKSTGGRRAERLGLNPEWKFTLGLYLGPRRICGVLANLRGEIKERVETELAADAGRRRLVAAIQKTAAGLAERVAASRVLGTGLAVTGMVDSERRTIVQSAFFPGLVGVDLADVVRGAVSAPVEIDTSARCLGIGEARFGSARGIGTFVCLELGRGIGCAVLCDGQLHRGASGGAGELGHSTVVDNGPLCGCGHRGCLETVASVGAIESEVRKRLRRRTVRFADVVSLCQEEIPPVLEIVRRTGHYIGLSVSNIVNLLNPSHIVVGGELARLGNPLIETIDEALAEHTMPASYETLRILPADFEEDVGAALGAAGLVIDKVFQVQPLDRP